MKTTLAILIAGLIFLATPLLAVAHGSDRHDHGPRHYKSWAHDRYDGDHYRYDRADKWERRADKWERKWEKRQAKKHFKKHLRKHHRQYRDFARHHRPYHAKPTVVVGTPRIVFRIDW
jgi:hypothetical protein